MEVKKIGRPVEILSADGTQKRCYKCATWKPLDDFTKSVHCHTGRAGRCKECSKLYYPTGESARKANLRNKYGITPEIFAEMLEAQSGVCAICGGTDLEQSRKHLSVDHDHITGAVRGLLCDRCNRGIGLFRDDPDALESAAAYLRKAAQS